MDRAIQRRNFGNVAFAILVMLRCHHQYFEPAIDLRQSLVPRTADHDWW